MNEQKDITELTGKQLMTLEALDHCEIGSKVLVFENYTHENENGQDRLVITWKCAECTDGLWSDLFTGGFYKIVGVGLIVDRQYPYPYKYHVLVNTNERTEFDDHSEIPF
jgi:hypothetical protein